MEPTQEITDRQHSAYRLRGKPEICIRFFVTRCKIAAEALRNAFRHAQARQIEVEIRYDHEQFRLRVRDDGKGIDRAVLSGKGSEGHYGLRGMRERATLIGGKLAVWSEVDAGTELELRVPASAAYATARRSWFSHEAGMRRKLISA